MKSAYITVLLFVLLATLTRSEYSGNHLLNSILHYERTGHFGALNSVLESPLSLPASLIERLATVDLVSDDPEALTRRLFVLETLCGVGYSVNFATHSLADCMDPAILSFLLHKGAQSARNDDLYQSLSYGDFEAANIFMEAGRRIILEAHLEDLLQSHDSDELREWLTSNLPHLLLIKS